MATLAAHGQAAAVPETAVGAHLDVPLDIHRDFLAEIAFDRSLFFKDGADAVDFVFGQIANLFIEIDSGAVEQRLGSRAADTVDVGETDLSPLSGRQIDTSKTCHDSSLPLPLFVLGVDADDPHHALAMDHLAFVANFLYRCPNLHICLSGPDARGRGPAPDSFRTIRPRVGS